MQSCLPCIHVREKAVKGSTSFSEELSKGRPPPKSKAFVAIGPLVKRMGTALQGLCLARTARSSLATQVHVEVHSQRQAVDSVRILFASPTRFDTAHVTSESREIDSGQVGGARQRLVMRCSFVAGIDCRVVYCSGFVERYLPRRSTLYVLLPCPFLFNVHSLL